MTTGTGCDYNEIRRALKVGAGRFVTVPPEVWEFTVSDFKVVQSWLGYRKRRRR